MSPGSDDVRRPVAGGRAPDPASPPRIRWLPLLAVGGGAVALIAAGAVALVLRSTGGAGRPTVPTTTAAATLAPVPTATTPGPVATGAAGGTTRYARDLATLVAGVGVRNGIALGVEVDLVPHAGGDATTAADIVAYRESVTSAALAVGLVDQAAVDAWTAAGRDGQAGLVRAIATLVRGLLPNAGIEIAVVGGTGTVARGSLPAGKTDVTVVLPGE